MVNYWFWGVFAGKLGFSFFKDTGYNTVKMNKMMAEATKMMNKLENALPNMSLTSITSHIAKILSVVIINTKSDNNIAKNFFNAFAVIVCFLMFGAKLIKAVHIVNVLTLFILELN